MAALAAATSGWSNGWMPSSAPARAVANSHSRTCSPRSANDPPLPKRTTGWPASASASSGPAAGPGSPTATNIRSSPYTDGSPRGSPTTGTMPVPSLPVDSARSCSSHSPNVARFREPRASACPGPPRPPSRRGQPGRRVGRRRRPQRLGDARADASSPSTSAPARIAGTSPEQRQGRVPPPMSGGFSKAREPALGGQRRQLAAGIRDHGEARDRGGGPRPRPGGCAFRASSRTSTPRVSSVRSVRLAAQPGDGGGIGGVEHVQRRRRAPDGVERATTSRSGLDPPMPASSTLSTSAEMSAHVAHASSSLVTMSGTTVSHPSRSLISVGSSPERVVLRPDARHRVTFGQLGHGGLDGVGERSEAVGSLSWIGPLLPAM